MGTAAHELAHELCTAWSSRVVESESAAMGGGVAEEEEMEGREEKEEQPGSSAGDAHAYMRVYRGDAHAYIEPCESLSGSQ